MTTDTATPRRTKELPLTDEVEQSFERWFRRLRKKFSIAEKNDLRATYVYLRAAYMAGSAFASEEVMRRMNRA